MERKNPFSQNEMQKYKNIFEKWNKKQNNNDASKGKKSDKEQKKERFL